MTATTTARNTQYAGEVPGHGTFGIAENTLLLKGTIVTKDSAGRAAVPGAGQDAMGISAQTYDNRTTSDLGGAADAKDAEVLYGVHGFAIDGTTPKPGDVVYVVDNQTVSLDANGGRGIAGIVSEVRANVASVDQAYVAMGPHYVAAARGAAQVVDLPISAFRLSTGAALPAFSAGVADGLTLADSEGFGHRINDDSTTAIAAVCKLPENVKAGAVVTLHCLVSRIGATNTAAELLTPAVFANREGVAYDAGASLVSGNFGVVAGATKVVHELTKTITGAQAGDALTVTLTPIAAGLADDDLLISAVWISVR